MANYLVVAALLLASAVQGRRLNDLLPKTPVGAGHHHYILAIGGLNEEQENTVSVFDEETKAWTAGMPLPYPVYGSGASGINFKHAKNSILITGGDSTDSDFGDPITKTALLNVTKANGGSPVHITWEVNKVKMLPVPRVEHAQVTVDNKVYIWGGQISYDGFTATGIILDTASNKWEKAKDMPTPGRAEITAAVLDHDIYIMGGYDGVNFLSDTLKYSIKEKKWTSAAQMNVGRIGAAATTGKNKKIYCGGGQQSGEDRFASVEEYDPKTNTWTTLQAEMSVARSYMGFTTMSDGALLACGGVSEEYYASCEAYNPKHPEKGWVMMASMPVGVTALDLVAIPH